MTGDTETGTTQKTRYRVRCHDHKGWYWHLTTHEPQMCQHCGSYNIEWAPEDDVPTFMKSRTRDKMHIRLDGDVLCKSAGSALSVVEEPGEAGLPVCDRCLKWARIRGDAVAPTGGDSFER